MSWRIFWPLIAILLAFVVGGLLTLAFGHNPLAAYGALLSGAWGGSYAIAATLTNALPLMVIGLGVALAFQGGLFNIGASGQYWMGAIAAAWVGYSFHLPVWIHLPLALLAGVVAGALWGSVVPGLAKAYRGANEVITTLMMTYVAVYLGHYLVEGGPMQAPGYTPQSPAVLPSALIPVLIPNTQLSWAILFVPLLALVVWFFFYRTVLGFALRVSGANPKAARYAGIQPVWMILLTLALSGGIAGLAGAVQVLGVDGRLFDSFDTNAGFTAIVVALLGRNDPWGVLLAALLFGMLASGANQMQIAAGVPVNLVEVIQGVIIFFVAAEGLLDYVARRRKVGA
jgi:ABC-type uncharacterized transport system permease subunit